MQKDKIIKLSILFITFILCGCLYSCQNTGKSKVTMEESTSTTNNQENENIEVESTSEETKKTDSLIYVYICGEVKAPGVYQVEEGARLYQVVEMAGGVLETASPNYLNLAECVTDGQKIVVPTIEEAKELAVSENNSSSNLVNINTATIEMLTSLPGIGTSKANSIITYRESKGGFQSIEELMEVEGIKEGVFNKVKDLITVK